MTRVYCDICGKEVVRKKEIWKHTLTAREGSSGSRAKTAQRRFEHGQRKGHKNSGILQGD